MTHAHGYYGETSSENPTELAIWNLAAFQASSNEPIQFSLIDIAPRHRCHVNNAYKVVAKAVAAGLHVTEDKIENHCYDAGLKGQSLKVTLESVGYWLHDSAEAYWKQGRREAQADLAIAPEYTAFDRIKARVSITVENLGFRDVSIQCDQFDRIYTVAAFDEIKRRRVPIARGVMIDDILVMVDAWAIETVTHREMSRSLRVLNGFEEQVAA